MKFAKWSFLLGLVLCLLPLPVRAVDPPAPPDRFTLAEQRTYLPAELSEYIDGQAAWYILYGCRKLDHFRYTSPDGRTVVLDAYETDSPLNAHGLYLDQGQGLADRLGLGGPSSGDQYSAALVKGPYLFQVSTDHPGPDSPDLLTGLLQSVSVLIPSGPLPPELDWLPVENRDEATYRLVKDGVLRLSLLPFGFSADYHAGDRHVSLGLAVFDSPELARSAFDRTVEEQISAKRAKRVNPPGLPPEWTALDLGQRGGLLLTPHGRYVLCSSRLTDLNHAVPLFNSLISRLP